jgi:hypothetical protein
MELSSPDRAFRDPFLRSMVTRMLNMVLNILNNVEESMPQSKTPSVEFETEIGPRRPA